MGSPGAAAGALFWSGASLSGGWSMREGRGGNGVGAFCTSGGGGKGEVNMGVGGLGSKREPPDWFQLLKSSSGSDMGSEGLVAMVGGGTSIRSSFGAGLGIGTFCVCETGEGGSKSSLVSSEERRGGSIVGKFLRGASGRGGPEGMPGCGTIVGGRTAVVCEGKSSKIEYGLGNVGMGGETRGGIGGKVSGRSIWTRG
jgi:hypothetical protein